MTKESAEKLAAKILYLLDCQGLVEIRGRTYEEVQENIKRAREIAAQMIMNGEERRKLEMIKQCRGQSALRQLKSQCGKHDSRYWKVTKQSDWNIWDAASSV